MPKIKVVVLLVRQLRNGFTTKPKVSPNLTRCPYIANVQNHGFILVLDLRIVFIVLLHILNPNNKIRFSALPTVETR